MGSAAIQGRFWEARAEDWATCVEQVSLPLFGAIVERTQAVRRDGSAALNLAYVACGRFDAYWEREIQPWDVAAAALFLTEAGGRLTSYDGGPFDLWGGDVVASNGRLHDALLAIIASADPQ